MSKQDHIDQSAASRSETTEAEIEQARRNVVGSEEVDTNTESDNAESGSSE
jgi:hypothetical protein